MDSEFETIAGNSTHFLSDDPVATFSDRREHPREEHRATISIVMSKRADKNPNSGDFCLLHGLTNNISANGVSFDCRYELKRERVYVLFRHPDGGTPFFEARIYYSREIERGRWRYGAVLRRLATEAEALAILTAKNQLA